MRKASRRFILTFDAQVFLEEGKLKVEIMTEENKNGEGPSTILDNFYEKVNDGKWHQMILTIGQNSLILSLDGRPMKTSRLMSVSAGRSYYVGGVTAAESHNGFIGCMRYISISGAYTSPNDWKSDQYCCSRNEFMFDTCHMVDRCNPNPCKHLGSCYQTSTEFFCDCAHTGYTGAVCHTCK